MTTLQINQAPGIDPANATDAPEQAAEAPKVQTPTEAIIYDNLKPFFVPDERGRVYMCQKPSLLSDLNFIEMMGDTAKNLVYMTMVGPLKWIQTIDGEAVSMRTRREWDTLVKLVGNEGLSALFMEFIKRGIIMLPKEEDGNADLGKAAAEAKQQLKNS